MPIDIWWYKSRKSWCADVPSETGRKRIYLGPNETKARAGLYRYMANYYEGVAPEGVGKKLAFSTSGQNISLLELAVRFLNWNKDNRMGGTWRCYRDGIKHITKRYKEKLAIELTPQDVEKAKGEMIRSGYSARTINIMITAIKRMYNWAVKQGLIGESPIDGVEHVSRDVNAPKHPPDKHLALQKALDCIELCSESPPLSEMCEMMLLTGMRVGELDSGIDRDCPQ